MLCLVVVVAILVGWGFFFVVGAAGIGLLGS